MNQSFCLNHSVGEINRIECFLTRSIGSLLIFVSIFSLIFNFRFLYWSSTHRQIRSRQYFVLLSMIFSSISVIVVISPSVFIQCLTCIRWCAPFYCRFEGFVNYLNGCVHMFMLMIISIIRYGTVINSNLERRSFRSQSKSAVIFCWFISLCFALPPLFHWNEYIPEGIGFHCGLNWFDRSLSSRIYFSLMFFFVYFIPLIVLFTVNIRVYFLIRDLLRGIVDVTKSVVVFNESDGRVLSTTSSTCSTPTSNRSERFGFIFSTNLVFGTSRYVLRHTTNSFQIQNLVHLNRLKADRRFALASIFLISEYLLSWTPYAILALLYLFNVQIVSQHSIFMTIFAYSAKISMILNPFIYVATVNTNQLQLILFWKKCHCSQCQNRINRQIL